MSKPIYILRDRLYDLQQMLVDTIDKINICLDVISQAERFTQQLTAELSGTPIFEQAARLYATSLVKGENNVENESNEEENSGSEGSDDGSTYDLRGTAWDTVEGGTEEPEPEEEETIFEEESAKTDSSEPQGETTGTTRTTKDTGRRRRGPGSGHIPTRRR